MIRQFVAVQKFLISALTDYGYALVKGIFPIEPDECFGSNLQLGPVYFVHV